MLKYLAAFIVGAGTAAIAIVASQPWITPVKCTFDGGGTIANATFATTTEGTTWVCSNGTLVHVTLPGRTTP